jgi:hypothetical protein
MNPISFFKSFLAITVLVLLSNCSYAQKPKRIDGMVKCSNGCLVDQMPITVDSWLSYYYWLKDNSGEAQANSILPDSSLIPNYIWGYIKLAKTKPSGGFVTQLSLQTGLPCPGSIDCSSLYSLDERNSGQKIKKCLYGFYPITGVTFRQVYDFCIWRSKVSGKGTLTFRLPSEKEWKEIAYSGMKETDRKNGLIDSTCRKNSTCASFNYRLTPESDDYSLWGNDGMSLKPVDMFEPNLSGIFDMFGNVSEMTETQGVAKGGNFRLFAFQCHSDSVQKYSGPEIWLGFRCIVKTE